MIGVDRLRQVLPHRPPVLLVDAVSELRPGHSLVAHHTVTGAEPTFGSPAAAGSGAPCPLGPLLESWAQAAVLLVRWDEPNPDVLTGGAELISGIRDVALLAPVYPGDELEHRVRLERRVADAAIVSGSALVAGRTVLEIGSFTMARRPVDVLRPGATTQEG